MGLVTGAGWVAGGLDDGAPISPGGGTREHPMNMARLVASRSERVVRLSMR